MNNKITISVGGIIVLLVAIFIGYLIGRSSVNIPEPTRIVEVKWEKGDIVRDTIKVPKPYEVTVPEYIVIPPVPTDTAALYATWKDYHLERKYGLDFSNDTLGTFTVDAIVKQNKLISATSFIEPNIRTVKETQVIYKVPTLQFYALIGSSANFKFNQIQAGVDIRNRFMIGGSAIRLNDEFGYTINAGIKF